MTEEVKVIEVQMGLGDNAQLVRVRTIMPKTLADEIYTHGDAAFIQGEIQHPRHVGPKTFWDGPWKPNGGIVWENIVLWYEVKE